MQLSVAKINDMHFKDDSKRHSFVLSVICQLLLFVSLAYTTVNDNSSATLVLVLLSCIYCLFADVESLFAFVVNVSFFDYAFNLYGMNATVIPSCLLLIKLLIRNKYVLFRKKEYFIFSIAVLGCELMGDLFYQSNGEVILTVVNVVLFLYLVSNLDAIKLDVFHAIVFFFIGCLTAIYAMSMSYGNIFDYFKLLFSSETLYRFGIDEANVAGGAMSLPLYAIMLFAMSVSYFVTERKIGVGKSVFLLIANFITLFFAIMTISRSLYLGIIAVIIALLFANKRHRNSKLVKLAIIALIVLMIVIIFFADVFAQAISLLFFRIENDEVGAGRTGVWIRCLQYIGENPIALLFGSGSCRYPTLDAGMGAGAHNILIDILASWGLIGLLAVFYFVIHAIGKIKRTCKGLDSMAFLPLVGYMAFGMTALRSNSLKTWAFMLLALLVIQSLSCKKGEKNDT